MKISIIISVFTLLIISGCTTISLNMVHTQGQATDLVDETQSPSNQATVNPQISIPATVLK